eukprot:jgi/Mesen1/4301/ME000022S03586
MSTHCIEILSCPSLLYSHSNPCSKQFLKKTPLHFRVAKQRRGGAGPVRLCLRADAHPVINQDPSKRQGEEAQRPLQSPLPGGDSRKPGQAGLGAGASAAAPTDREPEKLPPNPSIEHLRPKPFNAPRYPRRKLSEIYEAGLVRESLFRVAEPKNVGPVHLLKRSRGVRLPGSRSLPLREGDRNPEELLQAISSLQADASIGDVLAELDGPQGQLNGAVGGWLVSSLCQAGKRHRALKVFDWLMDRGRVLPMPAYNTLIGAFARNGPYQAALGVMKRMRAAGVAPTVRTYTAAMQALSRAGRWTAVLELFREMRRAGCTPDVPAYNTVMLSCGRAKQVKEVRTLWADMEAVDELQPNTGTYSLLLSTFVQADDCQLALEVYFRMLSRGLLPSPAMYKGLVCVAAKAGRWPLALDLFAEMLASGALPADAEGGGGGRAQSVVVYNALLASVARGGHWEIALGLLDEMRAAGVPPDSFTWSSALTAFGRAGEYERAMAFHEDMLMAAPSATRPGDEGGGGGGAGGSVGGGGVEPTLEVCNAALLACQAKGKWQRGLQIIYDMERRGITPNVVSYSTLVKACEVAREGKPALEVYQRMLRVRCRPNAFTYAALIRTLGKAGEWQRAFEIFEDMRLAGDSPNVHVYNALIFALGHNGQPEMLMGVYKRMRRYGVMPDAVTEHMVRRYCEVEDYTDVQEDEWVEEDEQDKPSESNFRHDDDHWDDYQN